MEELSESSSVNMVSKVNGKPKNELISNMRGLYMTMTLSAMYPQKNLRYGFNLTWWIQLLGMSFQGFGLSAGIIAARHDLKKIADNLGFTIGFISAFLQWLAFTSHGKSVREIFDSMEEDWKNLEKDTLLTKSVPNSRRIMMTYSRFARIFFYCKLTVMTLGGANSVSGSLAARRHFDNMTDPADLFVGNTWYPVDYDNNFKVQVWAAIQMITTLMTLLTKATMDSCLVVVTLHLCGQFKILRYFIESMTIDSRDSKYITPEMRRAFRRHQELLKAAACIQDVFSSVSFINFLVCVQGSGTVAYLGLAEMDKEDPKIVDFLKGWGFYVTNMLIGVFAYCLCGNLMSDESVAIAAAAYNVPWYNAARSISLLLYIVMIRAQKPVMILAGKLVPMNMQTYITFVNFTVSYVSILRVASMSGG